MRRALLVLTVLMVAPRLAAQATNASADTTYTPAFRLPEGNQLVVTYIGLTGCGASRDPELKAAVRRMKPLIARQATFARRPLALIGISLDWEPDSGVAYLKSLGAWDEMTVGGNWTNAAATRHIWRAPRGTPAVPQVIISERRVTPGRARIEIGPERELTRLVGTDSVIAWVARGAPLPRSGRTRPPTRRTQN
jgi:hypothetical protein